MGGLARRVSYENALKSQVKGEVPILSLDAGHMFSDEFNYKGIVDDIREKNVWLLRAYDQYHVAAANVSLHDLPYLGELMATANYKDNLKKYPFLDRVLSANAVPATKGVQPFKAFRIEEVKGARLGSKPVRVGIVGVTEKPPNAGAPLGGYVISDPLEAIKRVVPELRKKVDLVVVLAYVDRDTAKKIGAEAPGIDLVLAAHQFPLYNSVDEAGDAVVAMVASQTKWLGEIRLYTSNDKKDQRITNYVHRDVPLDAAIPDDPAAAKYVKDAHAAFTKSKPVPPDPNARGSVPH